MVCTDKQEGVGSLKSLGKGPGASGLLPINAWPETLTPLKTQLQEVIGNGLPFALNHVTKKVNSIKWHRR